ncbi:serine-threonine phosophatase 2c [Cyclospora cayetanensis]|uniref:Serine-threonine phosophatase 2c n=1 Tax=Cyclospora cayetanensis TaxID=88456 RepID=A0A1D3D547_9EIME|nr:serine-threonine phosophatase 2c [Cyclospora cayetanensis]
MYTGADAELIELCRQRANDYASSTSVTAILAGGFLAIGHLGDSRIAIGVEREEGNVEGEFATVDHKPNMPLEQERIISSGGSVEYLHNHNNKPFIRGGDFGLRKSKGEQPMQLQYSRAFGGKDLKGYGLSCEPDVRVVRLSDRHKLMILATDGLWDVFSATQAVQIAWAAHQQGKPASRCYCCRLICAFFNVIYHARGCLFVLVGTALGCCLLHTAARFLVVFSGSAGENPSDSLVQHALADQQERGHCADNITAMVVFFTP